MKVLFYFLAISFLFFPSVFTEGDIAFSQAQITVPPGTGLPPASGSNPVVTVATNVLKWIITIFLILAVISFVITGFIFIFSFGGSIETAKNNFKYSVMAVVVVGAAYIIIQTIDKLLRGN